ncbi:MAG: hypothetical protein DYG83_01760 [Candidatus Brocadia sp. AMX2]|nr:MAG: hypothetical protein EDM70_02750 [Candidatus Brocadia sp. AMX2]MBC6930990.1 hypothetical protein [Candidatus Brocadia sp.]MBL1167980.1 hypothetical protein [Candidatus Brocadia sp. AMX1]MCE7865550.1 hypothetical protein [Candidatus Brocadia sp. AMX2]MCQ3916782.1 hypothetical protein [Candidatus Brocadia sp.]
MHLPYYPYGESFFTLFLSLCKVGKRGRLLVAAVLSYESANSIFKKIANIPPNINQLNIVLQ